MYDLTNHNTFGVAASCEHFISIEPDQELAQVIYQIKDSPLLVLGSGSNILFTKPFAGTVIKVANDSIIYQEQPDHWVVKVGAGVNWHQFVIDSLKHGAFGLENLALIPGTVGAAPVQNIGAYGVELESFIQSVTAYDITEKKLTVFSKNECDFSYRNSLFKTELGRWLITEVTFKLNKAFKPVLEYKPLDGLKDKEQLTAEHVFNLVIEVRSQKLPDPKILGNAGSFFKNPIVSTEVFADLKKRFKNLVGYEQENKMVKLAAGWLIDNLGLKGYRNGSVGVHKDQALVLVNYGGGTGNDILQLSEFIQNKVLQAYGVELEPEVRIL